MSNYIGRNEACERLNIHYLTLYSIAERNEIETIIIGKRKMYNVEKYLRDHGMKTSLIRRKVCYCRVSSKKQKDDLMRQIKEMKINYPTYEIISDIASGLNYERQGLKKILDYIIKGELETLVVAYRDRLTRFGYEMIEWMLKEYSKGELNVLHKNEETTPTEEITKDILSIMNVYVAKVNGLRKYKNKIKKTIIQKNAN